MSNNFPGYKHYESEFNWGAFLIGPIWGIFNNVPLTLIQVPIFFIPFVGLWVNIVISIWFGLKGNSWALENKTFENNIEFEKYQEIFVWIGIITMFIMILLILMIGY